jgi:hypothetical protein
MNEELTRFGSLWMASNKQDWLESLPSLHMARLTFPEFKAVKQFSCVSCILSLSVVAGGPWILTMCVTFIKVSSQAQMLVIHAKLGLSLCA